MADIERAVQSGDLLALHDLVDSLCFDERWVEVFDLRDRCRQALDRGKQLWPAAAYAEYRIALDAPTSLAVRVLGSPADRFTPGPFAEVIAATRSLAELAPFLDQTPAAYAVVHERVARGDDGRGTEFAHPERDPLGLPPVLGTFEPRYSAPTYELDRVRDDAPKHVLALEAVDVPSAPTPIATERTSERALRDLVGHWLAHSNGRCDVVTVAGSASEAIAALGCRRHRVGVLGLAEALDLAAWAGASGGAQGRRRGLAAGRSGALWALTALSGFEPSDVGTLDVEFLEELEEEAASLRFHLWDDGSPATGWSLRLAVEDQENGLAWAISATDAVFS